MKLEPREAVQTVAALVLSGAAVIGAVIGSTVLATAGLAGLLCLVVGLVLVVARRVNLRATSESVRQLKKRVDQLAVTTATDASANHREVLAAVQKLADEVRPQT